MITQKEYKAHRREWWMGKKVRLVRQADTHLMKYPAGLVWTITDKHGGFAMQTMNECPHCRVGEKYYLRKVEPSAVELISSEED